MSRLKLTHVALKYADQIWSLPSPFRHHHVLKVIKYLNPQIEHVDAEDEGFLDESGRFLTRKQAYVNADLHNQILEHRIKSVNSDFLTSEDLW